MASIQDKDKGMLSIEKMLAELRKTRINVGVFSDAINNEEKKPIYVADYAATNEYGTDKIPERSFMRSTFDEEHEKWLRQIKGVISDVTAGKINNIDNEIYKIGAVARSDIINKIDSNINPPNAPATIRRKGIHKSKTLIDHGVLRSSIEARSSR
jgi:hypothetical protein